MQFLGENEQAPIQCPPGNGVRLHAPLNALDTMITAITSPVRRIFIASLLGIGAQALAQQTTLYDPQPPANSAYVRVIVGDQEVDVLLDKRSRLEKVPSATPSAYMVVPAGQHEITVKAKGKSITVPVKAEASRSITVMVPNFTGTAKPMVIEDKINSNRLKAIISFYNLTASTTLDAWTADGSTAIFQGIAPGATGSLVVNPVKLAYMVASAGTKTPLATQEFSMTAGNAYSIVVTSGPGSATATQAHNNTVERYQGH